MEKNSGLLPFAYSSFSANDKIPLSTIPRSRHVIDENAGSMYHTRETHVGGNVVKPARRKGPTLSVVPSIKRKMGESFYENDDKKRQDINALTQSSFEDTVSQTEAFMMGSASATVIDSDQSTDVTEPDFSDEYPVQFSRPTGHNLPSSPPQFSQASEFDVSINDYPLPESPRRRNITLLTSPVKTATRDTQHSSEPDFGIDPFNRFRASFRDFLPSTDTECGFNVDEAVAALADSSMMAVAKSIIRQSFEDVCSTVFLESMYLSEIPDEIEDLNNLVIFDAGTSQVSRQLYLSDNQIRVVNPALFKFTKLNVLSLRRNQIRHLPNCIGKLVNLTDLNISSNLLKYLPAQILDLAYLSTFHAWPNPLLPISDDAVAVPSPSGNISKLMKWVSPARILIPERNNPSLKAICLDAVGKYDVTYSETKRWKKSLPNHLQPLVASAISKNKFEDVCDKCTMIIVEPYAEVIEWWDILESKDVPLKRKFCSRICLSKYQKGKFASVKESS